MSLESEVNEATEQGIRAVQHDSYDSAFWMERHANEVLARQCKFLINENEMLRERLQKQKLIRWMAFWSVPVVGILLLYIVVRG